MKIKLIVKDCISCGICMDVCLPGAINMRIHKGDTIEGFYNKSYLICRMMTFPYMANPDSCNMCMLCVEECPTTAMEISDDLKFESRMNHFDFV